MKKLFALLLAAVMCFSLAACGGDKETSNNNEPQTNDSSTQQVTENNSKAESDSAAEEVSGEDEQQTEETIVAVLDVEYLTGVWVWQEEKSSGLTQIRSFELCADGTGKVLASTDEELQSATFVWNIENETVVWSSMSVKTFGYYMLELYGNDLTDLTWSDFYAKEIQ